MTTSDNLGGMFDPGSDQQHGFLPGDDEGPFSPDRPGAVRDARTVPVFKSAIRVFPIGYGIETGGDGVSKTFPYYSTEEVTGPENFWTVADLPLAEAEVKRLNGSFKPVHKGFLGVAAEMSGMAPAEAEAHGERWAQDQNIRSTAFPITSEDRVWPDNKLAVFPSKDTSDIEAFCRGLKVDDLVAVVIKGRWSADKGRVVDIITDEINKKPGPFVMVEGGVCFDMKGNAVKPPMNAVMAFDYRDVSIAPYTEEMENAFWRLIMLESLKKFEWGRLLDEDLRTIEFLIQQRMGLKP